MNAIHSRPIRPLSRSLRWISTALTQLATSAFFTLPTAHAEVVATEATPPDFADVAHVQNGCFISTTTYLAKFTAAFPAEQGRAITVTPRQYETPHTIALISWHGAWWARDEYCGVFALGLSVAKTSDSRQLSKLATAVLEKRATKLAKAGRVQLAPDAVPLSPEEQAREVAVAARLLPVATENFRIKSKGQEVSLLLFRLSGGKIAVYDPSSGTLTAKCTSTNSVSIIAAVAVQLGYTADTIQAETLQLRGTLVAGLSQ